MDSREIMGLTMMISSFPLTYLIPLPLAGGTIFAIICAFFSKYVSFTKTWLIFLSLYFLRMFEAMVWGNTLLPELYIGFGLTYLTQYPLLICAMLVSEYFVYALLMFFVAKKTIKRFGIYERIEGKIL